MTDASPATKGRKPRRDSTMPLAGHLIELRRRLVIAAAALLVGMIVAFFITDPILDFVTAPIHEVAKIRPHALVGFTFNSVTAPFDLRMRLAFSIGIFLSAPVWLWQIWAFIMPGLTKKEIRYTIGFVGAAVPLFFAGCWVGVLVMPHIILLMAGFTPEGADNLYSAQEYYDFIFKLMIVIGVSFIIPVFLVALNFAGIMSGRAILKAWRIAILIACLFAALATPAADVVSMLMLAGILIVLYFAAACLSLLFDRRKHKRQQEFLEESAV